MISTVQLYALFTVMMMTLGQVMFKVSALSWNDTGSMFNPKTFGLLCATMLVYVGGAVAWTRYTAGLSLPMKVLQQNAEGVVELHRRPIGVVGSITPWNFPMLIAIWHIIPAILSGNTVVCKPSS